MAINTISSSESSYDIFLDLDGVVFGGGVFCQRGIRKEYLLLRLRWWCLLWQGFLLRQFTYLKDDLHFFIFSLVFLLSTNLFPLTNRFRFLRQYIHNSHYLFLRHLTLFLSFHLHQLNLKQEYRILIPSIQCLCYSHPIQYSILIYVPPLLKNFSSIHFVKHSPLFLPPFLRFKLF